VDRRAFARAIGLGLLAAPLAAEAQQAGTIRTIGVMTSRAERSHPFEESLRELGWVEGKTVRFERRFSIDYQELPRLARELVRVPVDVIFAGYAPAVRAAMDATRTIPIIAVSGDPVSAGFIISLARPGANVTGLAIMLTELSGKRLEILTQALPTARLIAVLANPGNPSTKAMLHETEARASALGVQLLRFEATDPDRFAEVLAEAARKRPHALLVVGDPMFTRNSHRLVEAVARHRLPAIWEWRDFVDAGGLMAYGPRLDDLSRRAATYVDRVLKGAKPSDLPVEQATTFEFVINMKTAKALGLTIPPALLLRADQVIE
jgi:putative ABC transport system substrate-binding protein